MPTSHLDNIAQRYAIVSKEKADGITYTPRLLSDFVADQIAANIREFPTDRPLRLLDPAVGDGELLISLLRRIGDPLGTSIEVYGFETDVRAVGIASERIKAEFSQVDLYLEQADFLQFVLDHFGANKHQSFFDQKPAKHYDLIIANPPYVRTQVMGADGSKVLAQQFGLCGRVDLYHAFILAMARVLAPNGIAGIIVSNRFMTTMSGSSVRRAILERFNLRHVWDLGDTKPFGAAVLPAVLLLEGKNGHSPRIPGFTTIYETQDPPNAKTDNPIQALSLAGCIEVEDGRRFLVQHGNLTYNDPDDIWRISTKEIDNWLSLVDAHTWKTFGDIGKIRVGVKTCADKVFIRSDWGDMPESERPELIRPLITHHVARRFKAKSIKSPKQILYPHESVQGCRRVVNLADYPRSKNYLERHRSTLMSRKYVIEAGRECAKSGCLKIHKHGNRQNLSFVTLLTNQHFGSTKIIL